MKPAETQAWPNRVPLHSVARYGYPAGPTRETTMSAAMRHAPPPTRYGPASIQAKPADTRSAGVPTPPTRFGNRPAASVQPKATAPQRSMPAPPPTRFGPSALQTKAGSTSGMSQAPAPLAPPRSGPSAAATPAPSVTGSRSAVVQKSTLISSVTYALSAETDTLEMGSQGNFSFAQFFKVYPAPSGGGYVIQQIKRSIKVWEVFGSDINPVSQSTVESYKSSKGKFVITGWEEYWEYFEIKKNGESKYSDGFALGGINPDSKYTSAGQYVVTGDAYFVTNKPVGFSPGDTSNPANGLPYVKGKLVSPPTAESNVLSRGARITWHKSSSAQLDICPDGTWQKAVKSKGDFKDSPITPP